MEDQIDEASSMEIEDAWESGRPIFPILALIVLLLLAVVLIYRLLF